MMQVDNPLNSEDGHAADTAVRGEFVEIAGERYYAIRNVDRMEPFFVSVVSSDDHWLFASSNGGLTAGRISPDTALFPYVTVDKIHDSPSHTGSLTVLRVHGRDRVMEWQPFSDLLSSGYSVTRNLYKNALGDKLLFEELNHDLGIAFHYSWSTSNRFGFVRESTLENLRADPVTVDVLDGVRNLLPAGTPRFTQTNTSNLVDAYKWTEFDPHCGLALFTLYSGITDRAEPCESLRANVAYCIGLASPTVLLSSDQIDRFRSGEPVATETLRRGVRGNFLVATTLELDVHERKSWRIIADTEQTQAAVVRLRQALADKAALAAEIDASVERSSDRLARIMAAGDAFQATAEDIVGAHHYSNVLFNVLRGGIFANQYRIWGRDLARTIASFNRSVYERHEAFLTSLPDEIPAPELMGQVRASGDPQLERLCCEYLPITFGRRHGDPSRPWNQFAIRLRDARGNPRLSYEGNWRDIFQNWEALAFSYPEFIESIIAKFVNASTVDGYNPYRITKEGIDWEVEDPEDPWSYIGYWGDHQIIYLQKLLELSRHFHPERLSELLHQPVYSYANVPYRLRSFAALLDNPKETVDFDAALAERIDARVATMGADGKLVLDKDGNVYQVALLEKLLVPLLGKLGNLVVDGGIWLNTQRPEWNDANNALVGQGLSMVTLYYLRRYVRFIDDLLADEDGNAALSSEVARWLGETADSLRELRPLLGNGPLSAADRFRGLTLLGEAAEHYRAAVYAAEGFTGRVDVDMASVRALLSDAEAAIDHSIATNRRDDNLYHAYNLMNVVDGALDVERLYPMLEGQVSALSAGSLPTAAAIETLEALFESDVYRPDQDSFMLYPDRDLPGFLDKNRIRPDQIDAIAPLARMVDAGDERLVIRDADGCFRFNADFVNEGALIGALDELAGTEPELATSLRAPLCRLYEDVFEHRAFTGRSGTMFGFEGLGSIYWHMVAKLLLAVQECFFRAVDDGSPADTVRRLGRLYYRVREGIGFNKTPQEFGAFPADPYSHSPAHAGARQPGMTGQVKEEILTRFGELGIRVAGGKAHFVPVLLRDAEFIAAAGELRYLDTADDWQELAVPASALAFTWCQTPVVYTRVEGSDVTVTATLDDGSTVAFDGPVLPEDYSAMIFGRTGRMRRLDVAIGAKTLFPDS